MPESECIVKGCGLPSGHTIEECTHRFIAAEPDPKPVGWTYWRDDVRHATCACGWKAEQASKNTASAARTWTDEHMTAVRA